MKGNYILDAHAFSGRECWLCSGWVLFGVFFHLQFSGLVVPFLLATGAGLAFDTDFYLAYFFFIVSGIWATCWWLCSDHVLDREEALLKAVQSHRGLVAKRRQALAKSRFMGVGVCVIVTLAACCLVRKKQVSTELNSPVGLLVPGSEPTPNNSCSKDSDANGKYLVLWGNGTAYFDQFPHTVVRVGTKQLLWLTMDQQGHLGVSADFRDPDMKMVAKIRDNDFQLNTNTIFTRSHTDFSTLAVNDNYDNPALRVRFLNPKTISITGAFNYPGIRPIVIPPFVEGKGFHVCENAPNDIYIEPGPGVPQ